jgi:hypothetical protein
MLDAHQHGQQGIIPLAPGQGRLGRAQRHQRPAGRRGARGRGLALGQSGCQFGGQILGHACVPSKRPKRGTGSPAPAPICTSAARPRQATLRTMAFSLSDTLFMMLVRRLVTADQVFVAICIEYIFSVSDRLAFC